MLGSLGQFVVKIADLAEAEGRVARRQLVRLGAAFLVGAAVVALALGGVGVLAAGVYLLLAEVMHPGAALIVVGVALLTASAGAAVVGRSLLNPHAGHAHVQPLVPIETVRDDDRDPAVDRGRAAQARPAADRV